MVSCAVLNGLGFIKDFGLNPLLKWFDFEFQVKEMSTEEKQLFAFITFFGDYSRMVQDSIELDFEFFTR